MLIIIPAYNWVGFHPLYTLNNQVFFVSIWSVGVIGALKSEQLASTQLSKWIRSHPAAFLDSWRIIPFERPAKCNTTTPGLFKKGIGFGSSLYRFTWFGAPCNNPCFSPFHALWRAPTVFHLLEQKIKIKSEGCEWVLVYPGVVNSIFGYRFGYRSGECLGPGNFDNRTCAVQEHASTTFDAAGSAETFFALLCTTHAYNRTHVYYSSIRLRYRFWEFTVSVSILSRHKH